jgi:trehalose/maltose hydrolase-like predicted phosphorylase
MTRILPAGLLSVVLMQAANASLSAQPANAPSPSTDSFELSATARDIDHYYPTYLANGYFSMASSLLGTGPTPAQMIGVMDYTADDVSRPAAIPSWNEIDYFDGSAWLNASKVSAASHTDYHQTLAMRDGLLTTRYGWHDGGRNTDIAVTSFVSQSASHFAVVTLALTPRFSGTIRLRFTLRLPPPPPRLPLAAMDAQQFTAASNATSRPDLASGGNRNAIWYAGQVGITASGASVRDHSLWMQARAVGGRSMTLAAAVGWPAGLPGSHWTKIVRDDAVVLEADARVQRGRTYRFTKFVAATAAGWAGGNERDDVREAAAAIGARGQGLRALRNEHVAAWHALWRSDIQVGGSPDLQRTLHSDLFYLLENTASDTSWPAAACGFSGNYFGHVFWDNDFWVFPPLLLLHPARAKSLITFRQRTLAQALARARAHGLNGAMYPWEADPWTGTDVTPKFASENADREIHVSGAVAVAQWQYYLASGDRAWLRDAAYPVIKAVADFWVSRATRRGTGVEFLDVTSPEEDYVHVDNEIYTNAVARQSLNAAAAAAAVLGMAPDPLWRSTADGIAIPAPRADGRYYDFDPSTAHDKTTSWMATSVPMLSIPALDFQTDPATLQGLLRHSVAAIAPIRARANQMVLVMLATQAANAGDEHYFSEFLGGRGDSSDPFLKPPFNVRSETPQNDSVYLLATSGGFVQAFLFGLSGLRLDEQGLVERFAPTLPEPLSYLKLPNLAYRGRTVDVLVSRDSSGRVVRRISGSTPQ